MYICLITVPHVAHTLRPMHLNVAVGLLSVTAIWGFTRHPFAAWVAGAAWAAHLLHELPACALSFRYRALSEDLDEALDTHRPLTWAHLYH
jgi:hypothetical protein